MSRDTSRKGLKSGEGLMFDLNNDDIESSVKRSRSLSSSLGMLYPKSESEPKRKYANIEQQLTVTDIGNKNRKCELPCVEYTEGIADGLSCLYNDMRNNARGEDIVKLLLYIKDFDEDLFKKILNDVQNNTEPQIRDAYVSNIVALHEDDLFGGKRKRSNRKSNRKRSVRKSHKRKSHKRKSNKRKSNKRKSNKRKSNNRK